ncbi:DUF3147 family protein [Abyssibacter profundi]|uniref:DUF3147 domain-containing protein n=1 Tax=Abyssibacter profundi TaxID=2182787 RepID=A0A383XPZ8_9GAMM|nr:DUF3147 family protein [Abyssibacter profundi]MBV62021.1 hypothetical protein [Nevskiales bacterium]PWN54702.1 hypothetical protein DEH80_15890 [Abyssibacter profundi]
MLYLAIKVLLSAGVIVLASELAKRSTLLGALIVSLPLVSVLAMSWLYVETGDARRVASMSKDVFFLVLPSLALFIVLPVLIDRGVGYWSALALASALTASLYGLLVWVR